MVSLEDRSNYLSHVETKPKLAAFYNLLYLGDLSIPTNDVSETDSVYYESIASLLNQDKKRFLKAYRTISKRQVSSHTISPFVHDDFLIFSLLLGIKIFKIETQWIKSIVAIRNRNSITITLENILNDNYASTSNNHEIIISFLSIYDPSKFNNDLLKSSYKVITRNSALLENQNDILILCSLRTFDLIVEMSNPTSGGEIEFLQRFEVRFLKRLKILAVLLYNLILLAILYFLTKLVGGLPEETRGQLNQYNLIIGIVGAGLIGSNFIHTIRKKFTKLICLLFGYDSRKIESIRSKL